MTRRWSRETREQFFALVCGGGSVSASAARVGVSRTSAAYWWGQSALMELRLAPGAAGGITGGAPSPASGAAGTDASPGPVRRPLTSEDRAVIAAGRRQGLSYQQIGDLIGRDKSVIFKEVGRNTGPDGVYWAPLAHRAAHERRRRTKPFKLVQNPALCRRIEEWMDQGWSPKLIAEVLAADLPEGTMGRVSHETIYQALYVQTRGSLRKDLYQQLSTKRPRRQPRAGVKRSNSPYREAFKISQRPPEVADRAVPGHGKAIW